MIDQQMIIANTDKLNDICYRASNCDYVTIDTEFVRRKGLFYPEPSLVQLSIDGETGYICDVLDKTIDLQPLGELLVNPKVTKVFHSFKQDLHVIYKLFRITPSNVFDLQIASMFLGNYNNPSYNLLVNDFLGVKLDKQLQFSNWMARPLFVKQLEYAARDVTYLFKLFPIMREKLGEIKYRWVREEIDNILKYDIGAEVQDRLERTALKIVHRKKTINPRYLWLLNIALRWREEYSIEHNIIRNKIIDSLELHDFIYKIDKNFDKLKKIRIAETKVTRYILKRVEDALEKGIDLKACTKLVDLTIKKRDVVYENSTIYEGLKKTLNTCSSNSAINRNIICDKADIINIAAANDLTAKVNSGWRYQVFGSAAELLLKKISN